MAWFTFTDASEETFVFRLFDPGLIDHARSPHAGATAASGDQALVLLGTKPFAATPGELRFANGTAAGDIDGDQRADFQITVNSVDRLTASDFLL